MSNIFDEPLNADRDYLIRKIVSGIIELEHSDTYFTSHGGNGRFIQCRTGGLLISLCFHDKKEHAAFAEVHNSFTGLFGASDKVKRSSSSRAPAGKWAAAWVDSGKLGGNEAYYKIYD